MRTYIFLLLFFLLSSVGFAQSSDDGLYYSIDGKGWTTKKERDYHESDLQNKMQKNLAHILKKGKATPTQCRSVERFHANSFDVVKGLRTTNADMLSLLMSGDLKMFKNKGIVVEPQKAVDNEPFFLAELAEVVNFYIGQYQLCDQWVQSILKGENKILPWESNSEMYFSEQNAKAVALYDVYVGKMNLILDALAEDQKEWERMDRILRPNEEEDNNRVDWLEQNGYLFYSIDGQEYKTRRERIDRNDSLGERLKETLSQNKVNRELSKKMEVAMSKVFLEARLLQQSMNLYEKFGDYGETMDTLNQALPKANFGIYRSKSGETFYIENMADSYDCLCSIYSIVNQSIDEVNKIAKKNKEENADANTEIFFDFDKLTDDNGKNCITLFDDYKKLQDKIKESMDNKPIETNSYN